MKILKYSLIALMCSSMPLMAASPNFSYLKAGKTELEHDVIAGDFTGFEASGSYQLKDNFYLAGKYISTEASDVGLDLETKTIGIGYAHQLFSSTYLTLQLDAVGVVFDRPDSGSFDEQGKQFSIGIKSKLTDFIELEVTARRLDAGEVDADYGEYQIDYTLIGLNFYVTNNFAIYADMEKEDDSERVAFGLRYDY